MVGSRAVDSWSRRLKVQSVFVHRISEFRAVLHYRPLRTVIEPPEALEVGRVPWGTSWLSDRHRAVLDAAQRPRLVGGLEVLAEAFAATTPALHADVLTDHARRLGWAAALRRLGSLADALALEPLAGRLTPIKPITADLDLEPENDERPVWRTAVGACAGHEPSMKSWP